MIYFDNAATTLQKPEEVSEAVAGAMHTFGNASRGAHEPALAAMRIIYETREFLAFLFHFSHPERVVFTANATEGLNMAIYGLLWQGGHVITTALEHNSVLRPLYRLEAAGRIRLTVLPADSRGRFCYGDLERAAGKETRAVVLTHASNVTGDSLDLYRIGDFCRRNKLLFVVDASQTAGILPIDMEHMGIDALAFTGHKGLYGPQGTGGLCVGEGIAVEPLKVGGSGVQSYSKVHPDAMPEALEAGTLNAHGIAGLHAALAWRMRTGNEEIEGRERKLWRAFYQEIRGVRGIRLYGDFECEPRAPIVAFNLGNYDSGMVCDELMERFSIAARGGAHCAPRLHECLGTVKQGAVRFSFSYFNTEAEIKAGAEAVKILAEEG